METWRPVPGYSGLYEISDMGNLRSMLRTHTIMNRWGREMQRTLLPRVCKQHKDVDGYMQVVLCNAGKAKTHRVSRLVLQAFVGDGGTLEAGHRNNKRTDNRLDNLLWQTRLENESHKTATGKRPRSTMGMFTPRLVKTVRDIRSAGFRYEEMAALFGCHYTTLALICNRTTWK